MFWGWTGDWFENPYGPVRRGRLLLGLPWCGDRVAHRRADLRDEVRIR
jgi:hypothetical protein